MKKIKYHQFKHFDTHYCITNKKFYYGKEKFY